jgi:hypothetical protein
MNPQDEERSNNYLGNLFGSLLGGSGMYVSQEALKNDRRIENAVVYKLTKGHTEVPKSEAIDSMINGTASMDQMEEAMQAKAEFQTDLKKMFKEFKDAIRRKSITLEELEYKIYSEYGVVNEEWRQKANPLDDGEFRFKEMSEEEYDMMRESYDGEENTEE